MRPRRIFWVVPMSLPAPEGRPQKEMEFEEVAFDEHGEPVPLAVRRLLHLRSEDGRCAEEGCTLPVLRAQPGGATRNFSCWSEKLGSADSDSEDQVRLLGSRSFSQNNGFHAD